MHRLLAVLLLAACTEETSASTADFSAFDVELDAFLSENGLDGATAIIVDADGVLHQQAYGRFDLGRVSLLASSSKVITAGVVVRLHDAGILDLDEPVSAYVSDWGSRAPDPTLAQMLSNSSGMVGLSDDPMYAPYLCQYLSTGTLAGCGESIYTANDTADVVPPDTLFRYGGGQWQLAGAIAEQVSGRRWDALLEETYRTPCGIDVLGYTNPYQKSLAEGGMESVFAYPAFFDGDLDDLPETDNPNMEGGGYTTVGAYGEILRMFLRDGVCDGGRVLAADSAVRMTDNRLAEWGGTVDVAGMDGYGLGWWLIGDEPGVALDPGSFGAIPWIDTTRGYGAMILIEDEAELGFVAFERLRPLVEEALAGSL